MTALVFSAKHLDMIRAGQKSQTRRPIKAGEYLPVWAPDAVYLPSGIIKWTVGRSTSAKPSRLGKGVLRIKVIGLGRALLSDITQEDAQREGYPTRELFFDEWKNLHGYLDFTLPVWVVTFSYQGEIETGQGRLPIENS